VRKEQKKSRTVVRQRNVNEGGRNVEKPRAKMVISNNSMNPSMIQDTTPAPKALKTVKNP
jgi:hypothetical protein